MSHRSKIFIESFLREGEQVYDTPYFKKLLTWVQRSIPNATQADLVSAEEVAWGSGGTDTLTSVQVRILDLLDNAGDDLSDKIGSSEAEFNDYAGILGRQV